MTIYDFYFNGTTMENVDLDASPEEIQNCIIHGRVALVANDKGATFIVNYANINAVRIHQEQRQKTKSTSR